MTIQNKSALVSLLADTIKDAYRVLTVEQNNQDPQLQNQTPYIELEICGSLDVQDFENFYRLGMFPIQVKCINCVCSDCKESKTDKHMVISLTSVDEDVRKSLARIIVDEIKKRITNG